MTSTFTQRDDSDAIVCQLDRKSQLIFLSVSRLVQQKLKSKNTLTCTELVTPLLSGELSNGVQAIQRIGAEGTSQLKHNEIHYALSVGCLIAIRSDFTSQERAEVTYVLSVLAEGCWYQIVSRVPAPKRIPTFEDWRSGNQRTYRQLHRQFALGACLTITLADACRLISDLDPTKARLVVPLKRHLWFITASYRAALVHLLVSRN